MAAKKATQAKGTKRVSVELPTVSPKKAVVRFDATSEDAAMASAYISNAAIESLGGCENGVRITIEAL